MSTQDVSGFLPKEVYFRTATQSYCKYYSFVLVDGRIYSRAAGAGRWELFLKTGLPFPHGRGRSPQRGRGLHSPQRARRTKGGFPVPRRIAEISADADSLYAFDDKGILYSIFIHKGAPSKEFVWKREFGFPKTPGGFLRQDGLVRNKKAWSMGCRRRDVLYHTDIYGNEHHYGTMGLETLYFLTEDGNGIRFTDSGLPADFSRVIQLPRDGRFIAQNLSASADTVFIIGNRGTMYTRLIDFDTMGCDPMWFQYTYDKLEQKQEGKDYLSNYFPWALPAEDWRRQEDIPLSGEARLTRIISIAQNGEGNGARILRVAGLGPGGDAGYYEKGIFESEWKFVAAPVFFGGEDFLDGDAEETAESRERSFKGQLAVEGEVQTGVECEIEGVSLASEDMLRLSVSDGEARFSCTVYAVEKWTYLRRQDPGFDGTPRNYFVTLEFDEESLARYGGAFGALLARVFSGKNHKLFALSAEGTREYFRLSGETSDSTRIIRREFSVFMRTDGGPYIQNIVRSTLPLLEDFDSPRFTLVPGRIYSIRERTQVQDAIDRNISYRALLERDLDDFERLKKTARQARFGYSVADFVARITMLNRLEFPKIKQLTSFGGELMETSSSSFEELSLYRDFVYQKAAEIIDLRIERYEKILSDFDGGAYESRLSANLKDSFSGFYDLAGLPKEASGARGARTVRFSDLPYLPAYRLETGSGTQVGIMLKGSAKSLFDAAESRRDFSVRALKLSADFLPGNVSEEDSRNKVFRNIAARRGVFEWNGDTLRIYAKGFLHSTLLFEGRAP